MLINSEKPKRTPSIEKNILHFTSGLFAFENLTEFWFLDIAENPVVKWLQPVEKPQITFLLIDPFLVKADYQVRLDKTLIKELEIERPEDVLVYTTVTIPKTGFQDATTNLVGPIIINWPKKKAQQIIIERTDIEVKYPLTNMYWQKTGSGG